MQTRALKTLVEIQTVGSFAAAAARLHMTLSAVSMQMKALESEVGAPLFDRAFRPPRLTPIGRTVCAHAEAILHQEAALRAACEPADRLAGRYRIGFVPTASVRLLPRFLLRASRDAPAATFEVVTGLTEALEAQVRQGDLDIALLTASPGRDPGLAEHTLRREALAFAAPPQPADSDPAALLAALPFLQFTPSSGIGQLIAAHMAAPFAAPTAAQVAAPTAAPASAPMPAHPAAHRAAPTAAPVAGSITASKAATTMAITTATRPAPTANALATPVKGEPPPGTGTAAAPSAQPPAAVRPGAEPAMAGFSRGSVPMAGPREPIVLDSVEAIMECVNCGVGFTLLPEPDIRRYAVPQTRIFAPAEPGLWRTLVLVAAEARHPHLNLSRLAGLFGPDVEDPAPQR